MNGHERAASHLRTRPHPRVGQGRAALRQGRPRVPRLRGRHRGERLRLRRPQDRHGHREAGRASSSTRATCSTPSPRARSPSGWSRSPSPRRSSSRNSGTEAWEGAMKFARRIGKEQGRIEYVASSTRSTAARWARSRPPGPPSTASPSSRSCPGVRFVPRGTTSPRSRRPSSDKTAAVMIEPVQGEGGIRPGDARVPAGPRGDLPRARARSSSSTRSSAASAAPGRCSRSSTRASSPTS